MFKSERVPVSRNLNLDFHDILAHTEAYVYVHTLYIHINEQKLSQDIPISLSYIR